MQQYDVAPLGPVMPPDPTALHPNDYRQPSVRNIMFSGPAETRYAKLWIDFNWLFSGWALPANATYYDVWGAANSLRGSAIQRLDRQIRQANLDGKRVILTLYPGLPTWC